MRACAPPSCAIRSDAGGRRLRRARAASVVVDVLAAGLNPIDLRIASGTLAARRPELPSVVGSRGRRAGRRTAAASTSDSSGGSLAERAAVPAEELVEVPDGVDDADAVAYGVAGLAAWLALDKARLAEGETVLVLGASGPVGAIAVQLARLRGAGRGDRRASRRAAPTHRRSRRARSRPSIDVVIDPLWGAPAEAAVAGDGVPRPARPARPVRRRRGDARLRRHPLQGARDPRPHELRRPAGGARRRAADDVGAPRRRRAARRRARPSRSPTPPPPGSARPTGPGVKLVVVP